MSFLCTQIAPTSAFDLLDKLGAELVSRGWELHDRYIAFTAGKNPSPSIGDQIQGNTSGVTANITDIVVTSGSFAAGNAVGFFGLTNVSGQFASETLKNNTVPLNPCATTNAVQFRVYKSNGEDADRIPEYIRLQLSGTTITILAYGWWNNATHTGNNASGAPSTLGYIASAKYVISGNKNLVATHRIGYSSPTLYDTLFGHVPKRFYASPLATLTAPVTAGDGKTLSLDNTTKFIPNQTYWLFGAAGEGRDRIKVTSVNPGVSITGDGLTIGFAVGAMVGAMPSVFFNISSSSPFYPNFTAARDVGTGGGLITASDTPFIPRNNLDPDYSLGYLGAPLNTVGLYVLQPLLFVDGTFPIGYSDNYIINPPLTTNDDIYGVTADGQPLDTGTATDGSSLTLTCAGKSWGVNEFADKTVIIVSGTGAGYTRRIISNTAEVLTIGTIWDVTPNPTSIFYIVDEAYRCAAASTFKFAYREYI